jgi:hypothetical protein
VSVGFAGQIKDAFGFLLSGGGAQRGQITHAFLLAFAMIVVLGSWEFYFRAIKRSPLYDLSRFSIDICIVSLYVMLMVESSDPTIFVNILLVIMLLYIMWDVLRVWNDPMKFGIEASRTPIAVARVYARLFSVPRAIDRSRHGPGITLWWFLVMSVIVVVYKIHLRQTIAPLVILLIAYILYRIDQADHHEMPRRLIETGGLMLFLCASLYV